MAFLRPQWRAFFEILIRYVSCDDRYSHVHYYHLWLLIALKGCRLNPPFFLLQILKRMAHTVHTTIGDVERILFHHGLLKILFQHQLSLFGWSWDEFLDENDFGLTQYWSTLHPKNCRKLKGHLKFGVGSKPRSVESPRLDAHVEDSMEHTIAIEPLPLIFETPVVSASLGELHTVPIDEVKNWKKIKKEKLKSKFTLDLSNIPIAKLGSRRITRSMISSASIKTLKVQESSLIEILGEEEYYCSMDLSS